MPKTKMDLDQAYAQVVGRVLQTPTDIHVNMVLDAELLAAVTATQEWLAEQGARDNRSEAMRLLMRDGIMARLYATIDPEDYEAMKVATVQRALTVLAEGQGQA